MSKDKSQNKFVVLRIAKLKSALSITASAQHNLREVMPENADPTRTHLNENIGPTDTSRAIFELTHERVASTDKVDGKATVCMEYVVSASAAQMAKPEFDDGVYFRDALAWIEAKHGKDNVVSANIHRDELEPHLHVHIVPIVQREATTRKRSVVIGKDADGKQLRELRDFEVPAQSEVSANHYFGGPGKCSAMQTDFSEAVGQKHGLVRGVKRYGIPGSEKIDYTATRTFWRDQDMLRREFESLRADLELLRAKLEEDRKAVEVERAKLEDDRKAVQKEREMLQRVGPKLDQRGLAQDKRQAELNDLAALLDSKKADHNAMVEKLKLDLSKIQQAIDAHKQAVSALKTEKAEWALVTGGVKPLELQKALAIVAKERQGRSM